MAQQEPLPPGQVVGKKFVIYAALGVPSIDIDEWALTIDGLVSHPLKYTYKQLLTHPLERLVRTFDCVTRWSIRDVEWEGLRLRKLVEPAGVSPDAQWVMFHCADGYTAPVEAQDALRDDAFLAFKINGKPLSEEQGFPARPFFPNLYGWKSAKWVNRMEFMRDYRDGYWETYGYHQRARAWEEERFKGHSGKPVPRTALGTA